MKRIALVIALGLLGACTTGDETPGEDRGDPEAAATAPGTMEVIARGLTLEAPDTVPSGWTTIRFANQSPLIHFALVERMPVGQGIASQQEEVAPIFQEGYELLVAGDVDAALARFGELPSWFGEIVFLGGPGLTSPGRTSQATVYLEPGTYLLECYVKTDGVFHSYNPDPAVYGMVHEFTVTSEPSGTEEPSGSVHLEISGTDGIRVEGDVTAGVHTVSVHFADQIVYDNFVGHDVHLVRLSDDVDLEALESWMDWTQPLGLQTPAPATFVGGTNEMPAGATTYFTVELESGEYAWISEVPGPAAKGLLLPFSVP